MRRHAQIDGVGWCLRHRSAVWGHPWRLNEWIWTKSALHEGICMSPLNTLQ